MLGVDAGGIGSAVLRVLGARAAHRFKRWGGQFRERSERKNFFDPPTISLPGGDKEINTMVTETLLVGLFHCIQHSTLDLFCELVFDLRIAFQIGMRKPFNLNENRARLVLS